MESQTNYAPNKFQQIILSLLALFLIAFILIFKNSIFESTLILKNFGKLSMDPELAFSNGKPTYLEFYAEWCEICKEMAPEIADLKDDFDSEINFVFLNVDNSKWDKYVKQFNVNGIPQINLMDSNATLLTTLIGLQEESTLKESINYLMDKG